jgi:hypothetical protein
MEKMKNLFTQKGYLMLKCLINQIALSLFGLMVSGFAVTDAGTGWLLPIGIFATLFYYFILISFIREDGLKDGLKVEGGRMKKDIFLSVKYCAIASVPGMLFPLVNLIVRMISHFGNVTSDAITNISGICNTVTRILTYGMYNPVDSYLFNHQYGLLKSISFVSDWGISFLIYTLLTIAVAFFAYFTGVNQMFTKKENRD